jgi:isopenicillin N synthase-like dioxygenase
VPVGAGRSDYCNISKIELFLFIFVEFSMLDVIDLSGLRDKEPGAVDRIAKEIGRACRDIGFFYVRNHGIPAEQMDAVFAVSREFFALPLESKNELSIAKSKHNRGYAGISSERLDSKHADLKEAFNVGLDLDPNDPEVLTNKPFRGVNMWPAAMPQFRATVLDYFNAAWRLGRDIHLAFAADLGLPPAFFADKFDRPMATLRMLHYPPRPAGALSSVGAGEHTDYGSVTLLLTDDAGGLEVRRRDGTWVSAPPIPGAFVCNIGDCLMRWSNDIYLSTPHRVTNPAGRDRYSVAFFLDPNPDTLVECLPGCATGTSPSKYPAILAADYLKSRLAATYA